MKQETINKIQELKKKGKTCKEVSEILKISYSKCLYHYNKEYGIKQIERSKQWSKENPDKKDKEKVRAYNKKYRSDYYHDTENHERLKEYHRNWEKKRYHENKNKK